jgi:hypothetical protein
MSAYKKTALYKQIYGRTQKKLYRLKIKQRLGEELTAQELELLNYTPTQLATKLYSEEMKLRQQRRIQEEKMKEKHTLQYDRFTNPSSVKTGILVKAGEDFVPIPIKKQENKPASEWANLV